MNCEVLTKLFKLATEMDTKGLYTEADELDKAISLMAKRVGLNLKDMVILANDLDVAGNVAVADTIDTFLKKAVNNTSR